MAYDPNCQLDEKDRRRWKKAAVPRDQWYRLGAILFTLSAPSSSSAGVHSSSAPTTAASPPHSPASPLTLPDDAPADGVRYASRVIDYAASLSLEELKRYLDDEDHGEDRVAQFNTINFWVADWVTPDKYVEISLRLARIFKMNRKRTLELFLTMVVTTEEREKLELYVHDLVYHYNCFATRTDDVLMIEQDLWASLFGQRPFRTNFDALEEDYAGTCYEEGVCPDLLLWLHAKAGQPPLCTREIAHLLVCELADYHGVSPGDVFFRNYQAVELDEEGVIVKRTLEVPATLQIVRAVGADRVHQVIEHYCPLPELD